MTKSQSTKEINFYDNNKENSYNFFTLSSTYSYVAEENINPSQLGKTTVTGII